MRSETLDILRCPYCGGRLELVESMFHRRDAAEVHEGILGCHCCIFPVVAGIPVLHLHAAATAARGHIERERPDLALRAMVGLETDDAARQFEALQDDPAATYQQIVESLGPGFEGGYFLYRFSDPTYVVAEAVVRAVAGVVLAGEGARGRRAVDVCGGSGHLTRVLMDVSSQPPLLADLFFAKVWLAKRFTAPGCEAICCDGNAPMPFARGAFGFAMCSDAYQYIWTKRQFVAEMIRLVEGDEPGAVVINHTHNQLAWSPSHGQPLTPAGYLALFETVEARVFGEKGLFEDVVRGGPLDLSRRDAEAVLNADPALTIVASAHPGVFRPHPLTRPRAPRGEYRINPLYGQQPSANGIDLTLRFPSSDYEEEYGALRAYLPDQTSVGAGALAAMAAGGPPDGELAELVRRRIVLDLPRNYY
jgi:uncharacterized protein YbaR (Trm112 family)